MVGQEAQTEEPAPIPLRVETVEPEVQEQECTKILQHRASRSVEGLHTPSPFSTELLVQPDTIAGTNPVLEEVEREETMDELEVVAIAEVLERPQIRIMLEAEDPIGPIPLL